MRAIKFVRLTEDGSKDIGTMTIQDGKIVLDPPDALALQNIVRQPIADVSKIDSSGNYTDLPLIDAKVSPVAFLKACLSTYRGTYLWAEDLSTQEARPET